MKRKLFSFLLCGAMITGATSTLVSCKDYNDDINNLNKRIDATNAEAATHATKTALDEVEANLKKQLEDAQTKLSAAIKETQDGVASNAHDILGLTSRVATLETQITEIADLRKKLSDLKNQEESDVKTIYGKLEALQNDLGAKFAEATAGIEANALKIAGVAADLEQQKTVLEGVQTKLTALQGNFDEALVKINKNITDIANLQTEVNALKEKDKVTDQEIEALKVKLNNLAAQLDKVSAEVNVLNVLIKQSLRSIVFVPQTYYWGIEAMPMTYLKNDAYTIPAAAYNIKEAKGYSDDTRYPCTQVTKVLDFTATYHMNPSSAVIKEDAKVSILSKDVDYVRSGSAAGLSVKSWKTQGGDLLVDIDVSHVDKIGSLIHSTTDHEALGYVTSFATEVEVGKDTTVTSDYATLYVEEVSGLKLAHATKADGATSLRTGAPKSALSVCDPNLNYGHLMQTVHEACVTFDAQDEIAWNSKGLDLRNLVKIHYVDKEGNHKCLTYASLAAALDIKFELTSFTAGANATDESAHAHIADDGYTLIPNTVTIDGKPNVNEQNQAQEVGRTPVVRVSLVDKETGKVYDYGYIRFIIVDTPTPGPEPVTDKTLTISYESGKGYSYNGECSYDAWEYQTTWSVTEYDLYRQTGLTREQFVKKYGLIPDGTANDLDQYYQRADGSFALQTPKVGIATSVPDPDQGEMSSTLKWSMTGADAYNYFVVNGKGGQGIAVRYTSQDQSILGTENQNYKYIYVLFKTGSDVSVVIPEVTVNYNKNSTLWAKKDAAQTGTGLDEIHVNVPAFDEPGVSVVYPFEQTLSYVMVGNKLQNNVFTVQNANTPGAKSAYAQSVLSAKADYIFDQSNVGKQFKGISGKTYTMGVANGNKTLTATYGSTTQNVAIITTGAVDEQKIQYQETAFAKDLLNYHAHDALDDNTLTAIIGLVTKNNCDKDVVLKNNTFNVRFLRPLNVTNKDAEVEDASISGSNIVNLIPLFQYTDWRDAWGKGASWAPHQSTVHTPAEYTAFYQISGVRVDGVADGAKISTNPNVTTDQNGGDINTTKLSSVNGAVDFTYQAAASTLTYVNAGSTTADFKVRIPLIVTYYWGEVPQTITVTVKHTKSN